MRIVYAWQISVHIETVWKNFNVGPIHMQSLLLASSSIFMVLIKKSTKKRDFSSQLWNRYHIYINVELERKMKKDWRKLKTCVNQIMYFERKIGCMVYMMNWWWKKVGVWVKFEARNPPILLRHVNSLSM